MSLFIPPNARATDANSNSLSGALWYFYTTGTTTPAPIYTTSALNVAHANPVVADSGGKFANIFLDPAVTYRAVLKTAADIVLNDIDPYDAHVSQADLAADTGFTLVKHKRAESGTYARSAAEMEAAGMIEDGGVSIMHWIDPQYDAAIRGFTISGVDLADEINAGISWCGSSARLVTMPDGLFPVASSINLDNETIRVRGTGFTVIKYTGTAGATAKVINADRGDAVSTPGRLNIEGLILDGNNLAGVGVYSRGCNRSVWRNIRTRNVTQTAFDIRGDVSSVWDTCISSSNYTDQTVSPVNCFLFNGTTAVSTCNSLDMRNIIAEGATGAGIKLVAANCCTFLNGTSEGNVGVGVEIGPNCILNRFYGFFTESNTGADFDISSTDNIIDTTANSALAVRLYSPSTRNTLLGRYSAVTIDAGANYNDIRGARVTGTLTDNGTGTIKRLTGTATWNPASVASGAQVTTTVTVTGAAVGNQVSVSFSNSLQGLLLTGYVSAADTVTVVLANLTGGAVDLASGTLTAVVA